MVTRIIFLFFLFEICQFQISAQTFRAGVTKIDITPTDDQFLAGYKARKSDGVNDKIYHRIIILDDGKIQFVLVSSDIGKFDPSLYDNIAIEIKENLGIKREHFWWSVTHTHSAPEIGPPGLSGVFMPERYKQPIANEYTEFVTNQLIKGIIQARSKLADASIGVSWGYSQANINRRAMDINGKARLGMNPDGPVDRRIGLIRVDNKAGEPLALIANYAIHGTVLGSQNLKISGDVPGIVSEYVEDKIGAPLIFINGAAGNIAPIYSVYPNPKAGHLDEFKLLLGNKILDASEGVSKTTRKVNLSTESLVIETPLKTGLKWPSDLNDYRRIKDDSTSIILLPIRLLQISEEILIWSAPLELFCEISNEIRDKSPFPFTFYFGYTNGNFRYLTTKDAYSEGGYEPNASPFSPSAEEDLISGMLKYFQKINN